MVISVILATALWVCPGNVFSNEPREGCKPFHESRKEGVTVIPEAEGFSKDPNARVETGGEAAPAAPQGGRRESSRSSSDGPDQCALYNEYLNLSLKSDASAGVSGGLGAREMTTEELERWTYLSRVFAFGPPPGCGGGGR
jgi:hypothetical protein